jgi:hypothetical protein
MIDDCEKQILPIFAMPNKPGTQGLAAGKQIMTILQ